MKRQTLILPAIPVHEEKALQDYLGDAVDVVVLSVGVPVFIVWDDGALDVTVPDNLGGAA